MDKIPETAQNQEQQAGGQSTLRGSRIGNEHSTPIEDDYGIANRGSDIMPQSRQYGEEKKGVGQRLGDKLKALGAEHKMN